MKGKFYDYTLEQNSKKMVLIRKQEVMLTKREKEVLDLAAKGWTKNQIAAKLFVSHHTIKKHFENIYRKLKVKNKVQALNKFRP